MKILYLLTKEPDQTLLDILAEQKKSHTVEEIDIRTESDYEGVVDRIESADKVISW